MPEQSATEIGRVYQIKTICSACGDPGNEVIRRTHGVGATGYVICSSCGHIMRMDDGKVRDLTTDDKQRMRTVRDAEQMKKVQEEFVRGMWG